MNGNGVGRDNGNGKGVGGSKRADQLQWCTITASEKLKSGADRILENGEGPYDPEIHRECRR